MYKPMKLKHYLSMIHQFGWRLEKGAIDWVLRDEEDNYLCTIKISHPGPREVVASSVKKTLKLLAERGYINDN